MSKTNHEIDVAEVSDAERKRLAEETRSNVHDREEGEE